MSLEHLVKEWLRLDPNEKTRSEVQLLWDTQNIGDLEKRMRTRIEFGTAGLRGRMEAGWARMNDLIIIQTSQERTLRVLVEECRRRSLARHRDRSRPSTQFGRLGTPHSGSVPLNQCQGFPFKGTSPYTSVRPPLSRAAGNSYNALPRVPFSVKRLNAAGGVMITASHNPKDDNGFKVYWENAVQIIGPHDTGIAQAILNNLEPRVQKASDVYATSLCCDPTDEMKESYFNLIDGMADPRLHVDTTSTSVKFVNTSMHGVSDAIVSEVFKRTGFKPYIAVEEQKVPDPDFPTVRFPNPEEKGALDRAISTATCSGADYVLAQDPDSDRFSAAERGPSGSFTTFTGDQLGALFASRVLARYKESGKPLDKLAMVASTVSSKMVEAMAQREGFKFVDCLTGFKFIGNTALDLQKAGFEVPFGYEEAIGFMFGSEIRDKDGVSATLMFAEMATELRNRGLTIERYLKGLYEKYGYFETRNSYFICLDTAKIDKIFGGLRNFEDTMHTLTKRYPRSIARLTVVSVIDLTAGHEYDSTNCPTAKSTDVSIVLTIRTSGTEPKIKYYLEGSGSDPGQVSATLPRVVQHLANEWMRADEYGLSHA